MTLQTSNPLFRAIDAIQGDAIQVRNGDFANELAAMKAANYTTDQVFALTDKLRTLIADLNTQGAVAGLSAAYSAQYPAYTGSVTSDITAAIQAAQGCINWIVTNFPTDTQGFIQGYTIAVDGSRTPRNFTPTQTAGLQTALQSLIATVS